MLQKATEAGHIKGVLGHLIPGGISHLQYADDTLLLFNPDDHSIATIKLLLLAFELLSGLKINFHKSTLVPVNTPGDTCNDMAALFGCTQANMSFTYMGLPLGTTRPSVLDMTPFVCKAERRITAAMSLMSHAGRLALINSIITSLAIYPMGTMRLPPKIVAQLDKIRRHCLWTKKTADGVKHNSLAAWPMVCRPKSSGGLGVLDLKVQNDGLLLKFLHKFYNKLDVP